MRTAEWSYKAAVEHQNHIFFAPPTGEVIENAGEVFQAEIWRRPINRDCGHIYLLIIQSVKDWICELLIC